MDKLYIKVSAKCHNLKFSRFAERRVPCNYVGEVFVSTEEYELGVAKFRCPDCGRFIHQKDSNFIVID